MSYDSKGHNLSLQIGIFNAVIKDTPNENGGNVVHQERLLILNTHYEGNTKKNTLSDFTFFCLGLTALEVWCLAMIGLVFLAFLAYIVILAWLRTRLIHDKGNCIVVMIITTKPSSSSSSSSSSPSFCLHRHTCLASNQVDNDVQCSNTQKTHIKDC